MSCPLYGLSVVGVLLIDVNGSIGDVGGMLEGPCRGCPGEGAFQRLLASFSYI